MSQPKQSDSSRQIQGYNTGRSAWSPGSDINAQGYDLSPSNLTTGFMAGWADAQEGYEAQQRQEASWMAMMEGFRSPQESSGPSYEQQMADQQAAYDKQMAEQARIQGLNDRDSMFSGYMDAAGAATDYVNSEIDREQGNANLLGIDYEITDEQKTSRINDYFSTIWGEGEQTQLEGLMTQWGDPTGFTGFTVTRGDGGAYDTGVDTGGETLATSKGIRPPGQEEDVSTLGVGSGILGA